MIGQKKTYVLDGGTGREIERRGLPFRQPEWSALILRENPQALIDIHSDFIKEGAEIITTNTFAIAPFHIGQQQFLKENHKLVGIACQMAITAKNKFPQRQVKIALSVPPLFGSFRPDLFEDNFEKASLFYSMFLSSAEPFIDQIDIFLCETMSSSMEAKLICELLSLKNKDYMLSFALDDETGKLRAGQYSQIIDCIKDLKNKPKAIMVNCCRPETISANILQLANSLPENVMLGAYANAVKKVPVKANGDLGQRRTDMSVELYKKFCEDWVSKGATIIGGCCGIGPEYMSVISETLKSIGNHDPKNNEDMKAKY